MNFDLINDKNKQVHFIGIGGISMSGLAEILVRNGFKVTGSDMKQSSITNKLSKEGVTIFYGHAAKNVVGADLVVYTAAVSSDNPELLKAKELGLLLMDRAEFLGEIMKGHKYNVAVAGTHGKTTSTSMISHIIIEAMLDPTILVGGQLDLIDGNVKTGNSEYFITEACEYKASFLKFHPYIGIILNIDADHLDYYRDLEHIKDTFKEFSNLIPSDGYLIAYAEDPNINDIIRNSKSNIITYGFEKGDLTAKNIVFNDKGCGSFEIYNKTTKLCDIELGVPGNHNILNALASCATALSLNVPVQFIVNGLKNYTGTHKRFELKGKKDGITVIDDYAHHPTEIKATLATAKKLPHKKIYCVFQPHTYTRTSALFNDFANSFYDIDELILAEIYAARENDTGVVSSKMLGDKLRSNGVNCKNFSTFEDIVGYLNTVLKSGDLLLTVGAGDVVTVGELYLNKK